MEKFWLEVKMTKRLYYTCAIQALYMQLNFGVDLYFETKDGDVDFNPQEYADNVDLWLSGYNGRTKIYIESESEHIFELKKGDLINYKSRSGKNQITATYLESFIDDDGIKKWRLQSQGMNSPKIYKIDARLYSIIMRDNKQFFQTEVEND
jgi:hypothetical protein